MALFFIFLLHCFGIYAAQKRKKFVLNAIILNSYFLFFHIGFIVMWVSKNYLYSLNERIGEVSYFYGGFLCLIVFVIGAIHEVVDLFLVGAI